jgi:hypothetical protein
MGSPVPMETSGRPASSVTNNAGAPSPADYATLNAFGIVDFGAPLQQWKEVLRQRGVQPWKDVMDVTRSLVNLKMTAQDMERFAQLMDRFGANEVTYWMGFLRVSSELGLQGYTQVAGFVDALVNFGVSYRRNYQRFLGQLSMFIGGPFKTMKVANFYTFVNDMKRIGLHYGTSPSEVDDLMDYFAKQQISLNAYAEGPLHNAVVFFHQYSQTAGSLCPNRLADLRWSRVNGAETYGGKDRRTTVLETLATLGDGSADVQKRHRQYVLALSSYLFREEYLEWQQATSGDRYTDGVPAHRRHHGRGQRQPRADRSAETHGTRQHVCALPGVHVRGVHEPGPPMRARGPVRPLLRPGTREVPRGDVPTRQTDPQGTHGRGPTDLCGETPTQPHQQPIAMGA